MAAVQGPDEAGEVAVARLAASSRIYLRYGTGGLIMGTPAATNGSTLSGGVVLTTTQVLAGIYYADPNGAARTVTLPTASLLVRAIPSCQVGDSLDLYLINQSTTATQTLQIVGGTGGTTYVGSRLVQPASVSGVFNSGSGCFRIRVTDVSTPTYIIYRVG